MDLIFKNVMSKYSIKSEAEQYLDQLWATADKTSPLGRIFRQEEVYEAFERRTSAFEDKQHGKL